VLRPEPRPRKTVPLDQSRLWEASRLTEPELPEAAKRARISDPGRAVLSPRFSAVEAWARPNEVAPNGFNGSTPPKVEAAACISAAPPRATTTLKVPVGGETKYQVSSERPLSASRRSWVKGSPS